MDPASHEATIKEEKKLDELIESYNGTEASLNALIEEKSVFDKVSKLLSTNTQEGLEEFGIGDQNLSNIELNDLSSGLLIYPNEGGNSINDEGQRNSIGGYHAQTGLNFLAGIVNSTDCQRMKRMLFRVSRGRALSSFYDLHIENKTTKAFKDQKIFIIFYQNIGEENYLYKKLQDCCKLHEAKIFDIPPKEEILKKIKEIQHDINERKKTLNEGKNAIMDFIGLKAGVDGEPAKYELYRLYYLQQKLIFTNLNKCKKNVEFLKAAKDKENITFYWTICSCLFTYFTEQIVELFKSVNRIIENLFFIGIK